MALKKDKEKVLDEVWTQERVRDFLDVKPAEDLEADFHVLLKAYQNSYTIISSFKTCCTSDKKTMQQYLALVGPCHVTVHAVQG